MTQSFNSIDSMLSMIIDTTPITTDVITDINDNTGSIEWGKLKGEIKNQKDLISILEQIQDEIEQQIIDKTSVIFRYKGNVNTVSELPTDAKAGDVYNVTDTGANYVFNETEWDKLSETIDLSNLVTLQQLQDAINNYLTKEQITELITEVNNLIKANANKITEVEESLDLTKTLFNNYYDKETVDGKLEEVNTNISTVDSKVDTLEDTMGQHIVELTQEDVNLLEQINQVSIESKQDNLENLQKINKVDEDLMTEVTNRLTFENEIKETVTLLHEAKANKAEVYTKEQLDGKLASVFHYKGTVASLDDLPETKEIGDCYNIEADGSNVAWNGTVWDKLSETIDLSNYVQNDKLQQEKEQILATTQTYTDGKVEILNTKVDDAISTSEEKHTEIETAIGNINTEIETVKTDLEGKQPKGNYLTEHQDISMKLDKSEVFKNGVFETSNTKSNGTTAKIWNESDGGGTQIIDGITNVKAYTGVHEGSDGTNIYVQTYAVDKDTKVGTRINVNKEGAYLTTGKNTYKFTNEDAITTQKELNNVQNTLQGNINTLDTKVNNHISEVEANNVKKTELVNYYTKEQTDNKFLTKEGSEVLALNSDLEDEISNRTQSDITLQNNIDVLENKVEDKANKIDLVNYYTRSESDDRFITEHQPLDSYATKQELDDAIKTLIGTAPETLDTLEEIANKLEDHSELDALTAALNTKANVTEVNTQIEKLTKSLHDLKKYVDHYLVLTAEQEQQIANTQTIQETLKTAKTVTINEGTVCDIVIPEVTSATTVEANLDDYTTLDLTSAKSVTLTNTNNNNVVDLNITAPKTGSTLTVTLNGVYDTVEVENASVKVNEGSVKEIKIKEDNTKSTSISGTLAEDVTVNSETNTPITITNSNEQDTVNLTLDAPQSTVNLNGTYNTVNSTVGEETLIVGQNAHIKTLTVNKGNVIVKDRDINNRIDTIINDTDYTVTRYESHATKMSELNSALQIGGITIVDNDIEQPNSGIAFGLFASGNVELDLNGKTVKGGRTNTGLMFIRGTSNINITGEGNLENTVGSYGIWVSGKDAVVNIYNGNYKATTHCLYCEQGTINIYDGTFKITDVDKKFLLNCLDSAYTSGTAKINVYGGKFYGFNPAESMSEPNGPISFVAEGYHVNVTEENGETVYIVVKD